MSMERREEEKWEYNRRDSGSLGGNLLTSLSIALG